MFHAEGEPLGQYYLQHDRNFGRRKPPPHASLEAGLALEFFDKILMNVSLIRPRVFLISISFLLNKILNDFAPFDTAYPLSEQPLN